MSRHFVLDYDHVKPLSGSPRIAPGKLPKNGGSYSGRQPGQAARKAFNKIARLGQGNRKSVSYQIGLRETGKCGIRLYKGTRTKLARPVDTGRIGIDRRGREYPIMARFKITFKYIGMAK